MPNAELSTTLLRVLAFQDILAIRCLLVNFFQLPVRFLPLLFTVYYYYLLARELCMYGYFIQYLHSYLSLLYVACFSFVLFPLLGPDLPPKNPCIPSPCGPYSQCRAINNHAVCSCQTNYIGTPPACHPECMVSSECAQDKACVNQKCVDPCPGTCGLNARCQVVNHNPICSCSAGYTGDPFVRCLQESSSKYIYDIKTRY